MTDNLEPEDYDVADERGDFPLKTDHDSSEGGFRRTENFDGSQGDVFIGSRPKPPIDSGSYGPRKTLDDSSPKVVRTNSRSSWEPRYPYNQAYQTPAGHLIEYDDSPGSERVRIKHKSGTDIHMLPNGDLEIISNQSRYQVIGRDDTLVVKGIMNVIIESDACIKVKGDTVLETDGDFFHTVHGDYSLDIGGNYTEKVNGNRNERTVGTTFQSHLAAVQVENLGTKIETTVLDHTVELGANYKLTAEGTFIQTSYGAASLTHFGGLIDMKGKDADGASPTEAEISVINTKTERFDGDDVFVSGDADITGKMTSGTADVNGALIAGSADVDGAVTALTMEASTFEGTAKKADWATTAGSAPTGASAPTTPLPGSPSTPATPVARQTPLASAESPNDVTGKADELLVNASRKFVNGGFHDRILSLQEVSAACRNASLFSNSEWLTDQVATGVVLDSISSTGSYRVVRDGADSTKGAGKNPLANALGITTFRNRIKTSNDLGLPSSKLIGEYTDKSQLLSSNFKVSHMLAESVMQDQVGLSQTQIAQNMQFFAYSILEKIKRNWNDRWVIVEGLYNPFEGETISASSPNVLMSQGLGVGIQFPDRDNRFYYDVAQWILNKLPVEQCGISYIDYDPNGVNEPTLIVTTRPGKVSRNAFTDVNHQEIASIVQELVIT